MAGVYTKLCLLLSVLAPLVSGGQCPSGWRAYGGSCYLFRPETDSWLNAKALCEAVDGMLVEIQSAEENNFVKDLLVEQNAAYAWLGLQDFVVEGEFVWTSSEEVAEYTNWDTAQPDNYNGHQDCGAIRINGRWDDAGCDAATHLFIVCEREPFGDSVIG